MAVVLGCNIYLDRVINQGTLEAEEEEMFGPSMALKIQCFCLVYMHGQFSN